MHHEIFRKVFDIYFNDIHIGSFWGIYLPVSLYTYAIFIISFVTIISIFTHRNNKLRIGTYKSYTQAIQLLINQYCTGLRLSRRDHKLKFYLRNYLHNNYIILLWILFENLLHALKFCQHRFQTNVLRLLFTRSYIYVLDYIYKNYIVYMRKYIQLSQVQ